MFIRKSRYIALKDELEDLKKENKQLENKLKQKRMKNLVELLDSEEYTYAILVKDYFPIVYNDGRIEKHIRAISFAANVDEVPRISIIK